jgi:hypothetical protein
MRTRLQMHEIKGGADAERERILEDISIPRIANN